MDCARQLLDDHFVIHRLIEDFHLPSQVIALHEHEAAESPDLNTLVLNSSLGDLGAMQGAR